MAQIYLPGWGGSVVAINFGSQWIVGCTKNFAHKNAVKEITLVQKFWVEKVLSLNISEPKKNILQKICLKEILGLQNVWVQRKMWVQKNFGSKTILGPK